MTNGFALTVLPDRVEVTYGQGASLDVHLSAVHEVVDALTQNPDRGVLVDLSLSRVILTGSEERTIAQTVAEQAALFRYGIALLAEPGVQFGMARVQQANAEGQGIRMMAFSRRAEALEWLSLCADEARRGVSGD